MGYLPQFDNDIFISYRHSSNEQEDRWVDTFCEHLKSRLSELVGDIKFWRDTAEVRAGDQWRPEIADALDSAAIFLAIISRTYCDSDVCRSELRQFLERLKEPAKSGLRRMVPVLKNPTRQNDDIAEEIAEIHHHQFFRLERDGYFTEFTLGKDASTAQQFWTSLERLAQQLMDDLEELKGSASKQTKGTIYVATVGPELQNERMQLRSDLQQRGYRVVPEREYLWNVGKFAQKLATDLDEAQISVHQIARTTSIEPDTHEWARLQLDSALEAMKRGAKPAPLIWIQPAQDTAVEARSLIEHIERDLANQGVEYSVGSLEDFKTHMYDLLEKQRKSSAQSSQDVALVVEEGDLMATAEISALLIDRIGLETRRIVFKGTSPKDPSTLSKTLAHCKTCVVFWGAQSEDWVRDVLSLEALADRFVKDDLQVYAAPPGSPEKATFRTTRALTILGSDKLESELVRLYRNPRSR